VRLHDGALRGVLCVGGVPGDEVRGAEGDLLVVADERAERDAVSCAGSLDELVLGRWSAHHSILLHRPPGPGSGTYACLVARAVGINHVALEVGSVDEALAFYGSLFDLELRGRVPGMAFVDLGDQFIALAEGRSQPPDSHRHFGLVVDDVAAVLAAARERGAQVFGGNSFRDPWGNHAQVVAYEDVQFTKAPEILRGMGLELGKSERALGELREKGLAP
jgi:lactoylglutathione lyase